MTDDAIWIIHHFHQPLQNTLRYILRAIVMPFLRANIILVNPQIHANVMRPLFVLNFIFEPLFVLFEEKHCYLYFFNMNIDQMKRAIHIRCTQQFLYFESLKKSLIWLLVFILNALLGLA
jgi:hypothetical protein